MIAACIRAIVDNAIAYIASTISLTISHLAGLVREALVPTEIQLQSTVRRPAVGAPRAEPLRSPRLRDRANRV
jgi:hypothetical protein